MELSIIKIPVTPLTKKWIMNKYSNLIIGEDCIDFSKVSTKHVQLGRVKGIILNNLERYTPNKSNYSGSFLKIKLALHLASYGISEDNAVSVGIHLDHVCKNDLNISVGILSCFPEFSTASSIRIIFEFYGITDEEYNYEHFRRYFDRYCAQSMGEEFLKYRRRFNLFLQEYIQRKYGKNLTTI